MTRNHENHALSTMEKLNKYRPDHNRYCPAHDV